ncbi:neprilysin-like [Mercenaria mercenaria]|uniref:neprilysin-like n=1 Tax=Mercenaria mercenaria TaxID=6596 RepID=UPI00234F557E|nr:neprilysin-like [Mercenaria mercenaria]
MGSKNPNTSTSGWRFSDVQVPDLFTSGIESGRPSTVAQVRVIKKTSALVSTALFILVVATLGLAVALTVIIVKHNNEDGGASEPDICHTVGCTKAAARVLNSLDPTADPCKDFYQFACGGFLKSHVIPEDRSNIDMWSIVRDNVQYTCKYLLEDPKTDPGAVAVQKAKDLYYSCVNTGLIEQKGISVAIPLLNELGGWPILGNKPGGNWNENDFDLAKIITTLRKYNNKVIIDMGVGLDDKNSSYHIISFDQQDFGMPNRNYYLNSDDPRFAKMVEAYIVMARDIAIEFGADPETADNETREFVKLETEIAKITLTQAEQRNSTASYNKMTLEEMKTTFHEPKSTDPIQFKWLEFAKGVFGLDGVEIDIDETELVLVRSMKYYNNILPLLQNYPKRTIANYLVWRIMQNRARNLPQRFLDILGEYDKVVYGVQSRSANWKRCMGYTILQLGGPVGRLYVEEAFDQGAEQTALDMIHGLRDAFVEILLEEPWMDDKTRQAAREKAEAMGEWIGYASGILNDTVLNNIYDDVKVNRTEYFQNVLGNLQRWGTGDISGLRTIYDKNGWSDPPTTVNAQYSFVLNNIQFPAGIFQPPFYKKDQPRSMNYGGIGVVIGHEITHGFDDQGRQYDKEGNLKDWWGDDIVNNFKAETHCIVDQYGKFTVAGHHVDGKNTLGENIADNGGLKQSYRAYRHWVDSHGEEPLLPGVNYTHNQLFFISFAQVWCDKETEESFISGINTDPHSPAKFRVWGTLQNSKDFADTFQCKAGSFMNPVNKCSVWKK